MVYIVYLFIKDDTDMSEESNTNKDVVEHVVEMLITSSRVRNCLHEAYSR